MSAWGDVAAPGVAPIWGELRYGGELARLLALEGLRVRARRSHRQPVVLIPGFMAGDTSLTVLRAWLRRRGHPVSMSGIRVNVGCAEEIVGRLQRHVREIARREQRPVALIGQSRGGALARALAVREPEHVSRLVMLGSPVADPLAVAPGVLQTVRWMARLGDLGLPGLFSSDCADGGCCDGFWGDLEEPLAEHVQAISVYSRSDGIVDWQACIDPHARAVEVSSSHCGMSVHPAVYRTLETMFDDSPEAACSG